jgi:hypothetical protein
VTEFNLRAAVPDEVRVSVLVEVVWSVTLPKASVLALKISRGVGAAVPVPLRVTMLVTPPDELLEIVMVPLTATAGLKLT